MPLPGSEDSVLPLESLPRNRMHSLSLLGGSPALNLAPVQSSAGARREYVAMGGGCSLVPSTDSVEAGGGKGEGWSKADLK